MPTGSSRVDYGTTSSDITQIIHQIPGFDSVSMDIDENRQFYIMYCNIGLVLSPFRRKMLPLSPTHPIFWKSSPFATSYFRMTRSNQILFSGGVSFTIAHHPARSLPAAITYHGKGFHVKLQDAPRFRSYCRRYGHTVEKCCMKNHLLLNKSMADAYLEYPIQPAATEDAEMTNRTNSRQSTPQENQPTDTTYQPPTISTH